MNEDMIKEQFEVIINKIVEKRIGQIINNQKSTIVTATIREIDYAGKRMTVSTPDGKVFTNVKYPSVYPDADVVIGYKTIMVAPDPTNQATMFVVGIAQSL